MRLLALSMFAPLVTQLAGCADVPKAPLAATVATAPDGKADGSAFTSGAPLVFGGAVTGTLSAGGRVLHTLTLAAAGDVTFEITREGTTRDLDTTLHLLGPVGADGRAPATARAADDDGGYASLSKLTSVALEAGTWQVVVGTYGDTGRGTYRLAVTCDSGACDGPEGPDASCDAATAAAITACAASVEEGTPVGDDDGPVYDPYAMRDWDVHLACAEAQPGSSASACAVATWGASREDACVFGTRYADLAGRSEAVVIVGRGRVEDAAELDDVAAAQLVEAVKTTAYDDVTTAAEALEAVDEGRANRTVLWDASNGGAYVAWEVGAGDNSFGAIFPLGGRTPVATIVDGDFATCEVTWGPGRRWCEADADCGAGMVCLGQTPEDGLGLCADAPATPRQAGAGVQCAPWLDDFGCPAADGLVCGSADAERAGVCVESHNRVIAGPAADVEVPAGAETVVTLPARGIGATTAGVRLALLLVHPRLSDVKVTLAGPDGRSATVFDGAAAGASTDTGELSIDGFGHTALTGGAAVGAWTLRVRDAGRGEGGRVWSASLEVTARP